MSPYKISTRGLLARSVSEISAQALYKTSLGKISTDHRSLCNVSVQDLYKRCLGKISAQAPYNSSVQAPYKRCLGTRSLDEIALQALYESSLGKISMRCLCTRSLQELSVQDLYKRSPWQDLCASSLVRTSLSRSLHKISLTTKMSTAPQRERSDTPKAPRRLREGSQNSHRAKARAIWQAVPWRLCERSQNSHCATTRAIRHAQSDEKVAREVSEPPFPARLPSKTEDEGAFMLYRSSKTARTYETTSNNTRP